MGKFEIDLETVDIKIIENQHRRNAMHCVSTHCISIHCVSIIKGLDKNKRFETSEIYLPFN